MIKVNENIFDVSYINDGFLVNILKNKKGEEILATTSDNIVQVNDDYLIVFDNLVVPPVFEQYNIKKEMQLVKTFDCSHVKSYCHDTIWILLDLDLNKSMVYNALTQAMLKIDDIFDVYEINSFDNNLCLMQSLNIETDSTVIHDTLGIIVDKNSLMPQYVYSGRLSKLVKVENLEEFIEVREKLINELSKIKMGALSLRKSSQSILSQIY